jgi:hypothetical protein
MVEALPISDSATKAVLCNVSKEANANGKVSKCARIPQPFYSLLIVTLPASTENHNLLIIDGSGANRTTLSAVIAAHCFFTSFLFRPSARVSVYPLGPFGSRPGYRLHKPHQRVMNNSSRERAMRNANASGTTARANRVGSAKAVLAAMCGVASFRMNRFFFHLCLIGAIAAGVSAAHAEAFRFPKTGKHAFLLDLPRGWHTKTDMRGGLLLIPPAQYQHAMLYLDIVIDDKLRGQADAAVAAEVAKSVGVKAFDKQEPALITDAKGAVHRGTMFYGKIPEKRGLSRWGKIAIFPLAPNTWAQAWMVTQPGMNYVEYDALEQVLNHIMLTGE